MAKTSPGPHLHFFLQQRNFCGKVGRQGNRLTGESRKIDNSDYAAVFEAKAGVCAFGEIFIVSDDYKRGAEL